MIRFPLPTPLLSASIESAERRLFALSALDRKTHAGKELFVISPAGEWMSRLPVAVRHARMLLFANQVGLMPYAVILVAALSVPDLLLPTPNLHSLESDALILEGNNDKLSEVLSGIEKERVNFQNQFIKNINGFVAYFYISDYQPE
ncbi:unnamed protein product [Protopolystoma xenopodis]|uniref:Helicase-associated domain-containing protein n=1 Tax=Protopolystoma xenopodis TaxID=117903 RepID=A0A3S5CPJ8_9PLAT|nr:unnamed protein product [Protopolystoma xenopodis]